MIQEHEIILHALLNSCAINSTVDETLFLSILPYEIIKHINQLLVGTQFNDKKLICHNYIKNIHIKFYTNCNTYNYSITLSHVWVNPLNHPNLHLILRLNFLVTIDRVLLLIYDYDVFLSTPIIAPILFESSDEFRVRSVMTSINKVIDLPTKSDPTVLGHMHDWQCWPTRTEERIAD